MGFLSGNLSFRRFKVVGALPSGFRESFVEAVQRRAFRENLDARTADDNIGWVNLLDPDDAEFDLNKILYDHYVVLSLRVDRKRVPARLLSILHKRRCEEVKAEKGMERLSANHKREIKEAVEEDLLQRALPAVQVHDMCWDINSGEARLFATSDTVADVFRIFFKDTFSMELAHVRPSHWLDAAGIERGDLERRLFDLRPDLSYGRA